MPKLLPPIPFSLGTTSFIKWDTWQNNILFLKDRVDFIQLLFLEDQPQHILPTLKDLDELIELKEQFNLRYSIHLPHRIQLSHPNEKLRINSTHRIQYILDYLKVLNPEYYVLHTYLYDMLNANSIAQQLENLGQSLELILPYVDNSRQLAVESLHFDFELLEPIIKKYDLAVVIDVGQAQRYKKDYLNYIETFFENIVDIHIHGFDGKKDHESLKNMSEHDLTHLLDMLIKKKYSKNMLLELFSEKNFEESMKIVQICVNKLNHSIQPKHRKRDR